jgi:large subunit ribosomal protein L29
MSIDVKEFREKSVAELSKELRENREELLKARLGAQTGQLEKPHLLKALRRDIARLETLLTEKRRAESASA